MNPPRRAAIMGGMCGASMLIVTSMVTGCTGQHTNPPAATTTTTTSTPPPSTQTATPVPQPPSATSWDTDSNTPPVSGSAANGQTTSLATKAMQLFARRTVTADQWWHDLYPLLTPQAQQAYQGTDPRNVAPTRLTGTAILTKGSTPLTARVSIGTDAGVYLVILTRPTDQSSWRVDRIVPPEAVGEGD